MLLSRRQENKWFSWHWVGSLLYFSIQFFLTTLEFTISDNKLYNQLPCQHFKYIQITMTRFSIRNNESYLFYSAWIDVNCEVVSLRYVSTVCHPPPPLHHHNTQSTTIWSSNLTSPHLAIINDHNITTLLFYWMLN